MNSTAATMTTPKAVMNVRRRRRRISRYCRTGGVSFSGDAPERVIPYSSLRHDDDVAGLQDEILLRPVEFVQHLRVVEVDGHPATPAVLAVDDDLVLLRVGVEPARHRQPLEHGGPASQGVLPRLLDHPHDRDPLAVDLL